MPPATCCFNLPRIVGNESVPWVSADRSVHHLSAFCKGCLSRCHYQPRIEGNQSVAWMSVDRSVHFAASRACLSRCHYLPTIVGQQEHSMVSADRSVLNLSAFQRVPLPFPPATCCFYLPRRTNFVHVDDVAVGIELCSSAFPYLR